MAHRVGQVLASDCTDSLAACPVPILYLRATRDAIVRTKSLRTILATKGSVILRDVAGPHLLFQASPAAAWKAIAEFLAVYCCGADERQP